MKVLLWNWRDWKSWIWPTTKSAVSTEMPWQVSEVFVTCKFPIFLANFFMKIHLNFYLPQKYHDNSIISLKKTWLNMRHLQTTAWLVSGPKRSRGNSDRWRWCQPPPVPPSGSNNRDTYHVSPNCLASMTCLKYISKVFIKL